MPKYDKVLTSGKLEKFKSGARRDSRKGKGRYDLIPGTFLQRLAIHFENGIEKYGERNWEKGLSQARFWDSAFRHLLKYFRGLKDEDHLAAAAWNISCMIDQEERFEQGVLDKFFDDIPKPLKPRKLRKNVTRKKKRK